MAEPMTPEARKAVEESALRWEANAVAKFSSRDMIDGDGCALCRLFRNNVPDCDGCPIAEYTGQPLCRGTPHLRAVQWHYADDLANFRESSAEFAALIRGLLA